jgi:GxxExxY protein
MPTPGVLIEEALTRRVIGAFYRVYDVLGYGFLEAVYRRSMAIELRRRRMRVEEEVPIDVYYLGERVGVFRADLLVEGRLVVEIKATPTLVEADRAQLRNYLGATGLQVGLLLHFGPRATVQRAIGSGNSGRTDNV